MTTEQKIFEQVYTNGHCYMLAFALHREFGWPMVSQMGFRHPSGMILDATGLTDEKTFLARLPGSYLVEMDREAQDALSMAKLFLPDFIPGASQEPHRALRSYQATRHRRRWLHGLCNAVGRLVTVPIRWTTGVELVWR